MKITALDGKGLRASGLTFFEVQATRCAVENNVQPGETFKYNTEAGLQVLERSKTRIKILRGATGKTWEALIVGESGETVETPVIQTPGQTAEKPAVVVESAAPIEMPKTPAVAKGGGVEAVQAAMNALTSAISGLQSGGAGVNKDEVRAIVNEIIKEQLAALREANTTHLTVNKVEIPEMKGEILHPCFKELLFCVQNKLITFLSGPAGTGKNVLCEQVAKALGLKFYCQGGLQNKYELEGFRDAKGDYMETPLYIAMTQGGLFMLDEIDSTSAEVLVPFNSILANGYYTFPNGERIEACENFHIVVAGNTLGNGADNAYIGRFQMDASTKDRFAPVRMKYDVRIETACAAGDTALVEFFHKVREVVKSQSLTYTISPRGLKRVATFVAGGYSKEEALAYSVFNGWADCDIQTAKYALEHENSDWGKAFQAMKVNA